MTFTTKKNENCDGNKNEKKVRIITRKTKNSLFVLINDPNNSNQTIKEIDNKIKHKKC